MKQSARVEMANSTLAILKQGYYINNKAEQVNIHELQQKAENNTQLYTPHDLYDLVNRLTNNHFDTKFEVNNETTLDAGRRLLTDGDADVLCLNFASAKHPGGGFLGGALAQEECLARASGLYPCLLKAADYYSYHRKKNTCLYSDHMIYSPGVPVIKDEEGNVLDEPACMAFITSPAVNAGVIKRNEPQRIHNIVPTMRQRMEKLLALSLHHQHYTLVLGAWGCGVFQNDPEEIAQLFFEALKGRFVNQFKRVVFAVKTNKEEIIEPFRKRFVP